jgi:hypothetical protein
MRPYRDPYLIPDLWFGLTTTKPRVARPTARL